MASFNFNYISELEDEIALEGLDGITLEGLWVRLSMRPNFEAQMKLDEDSKAFLWSLVTRNSEIFMYQLPHPRGNLYIFNRYEHMDPELGIVLEPAEQPPDLYPISSMDDDMKGVRGSCATYHDRLDVRAKVSALSLQEAQKQYGQTLVLVASQQLRNKALCISTCIDRFYDLTLTQYVLLERIGRSRRMGEITQGKVSLAMLGESPKSMFYHRKRLLKLNLITKQAHQQKSSTGQTQIGSLLHLTRFYVERRSKFIMMIQRAVEILKTKPNNTAPYVQVKEDMGLPEASCRKLFKSSEFQRYIRNTSVPHRKVYPDAPQSQWKCKGKDAEKLVKVMELMHPELDPVDVCKAEDMVEEEDEEEDMYPGILDQSRVVWWRGLLAQAYEIVEEAGPEGLSQSDLARMLGQTKLDSRTICRNLQRCNTVHSLMKDVGRQRVSRYVSHKFANTGHLTQEFWKERQKMISMIEESKAEAGNKPSTSKDPVKCVLESNHLEGVEVNMEVMKSKKKVWVPPCSVAAKSVTAAQEQQEEKEDIPEDHEDFSKGFLSLLEDFHMTYSNQKRTSPHVTTRMMKRANKIIEAVRSNKVIDDAFKLQKMIVQAEGKEGYAVKMDKKSLDRLLDKLSKGGFLKNIIVKLKHEKVVKVSRYVVHPSITFDSPHLKSTIEQQKLKFLAMCTETKTEEGEKKPSPVKKPPPVEPVLEEEGEKATDMNKATVGASMKELKKMHQVAGCRTQPSPTDTQPATPPIVKEASIKASLGPKFVRMCEMHKLLFYLEYGYSGQEDLEQEEAWATVAAASPEINLNQEDLSSYPTLYCPELSWKMFIPPLPNHISTETGWAFVCDILLRLPLCIFVKLVSFNYTASSEINAFLDHPLKRNLLVKYLPPDLRQTLLQGRRYVTYVIDLLNRLCYVGLIQYGYQVMKEKDQVFVYINRHASLIDTTTSSPGYHHISADKEYVRKEYCFTCMAEVLQYWYDLWTISMHTPLGGHNCMQGKKITIQILERKPQIMESLTPRSTTEAPARDTGSIPGDGRGAGGLDSAMFAHLKRNWSSSSGNSAAARPSALLPPNSEEGVEKASTYEGSASYSQYLLNTTNPSSDTLSPRHRLAGLRNVKLSVYKPRNGSEGKTMEVQVRAVTQDSGGRSRKRKHSESLPARSSVVQKSKHVRAASFQRELKMRKKSPKKPYYDEEDRAALRRMNKLRVDWSSAEDSFLLLCKVAACFLFPNKRSQMITFSLVRDLLHHRFPESRNKTSRACQRRINYIMKNSTTEDNVSIFLEEVKQDASIVADFKGPRVPLNKNNLENVYGKMFRELMSRLVDKFASSEPRQTLDLPDTAQEFEERYHVVTAASSLRNKLKVEEVTSLSSIDFHVVNALIYSSLCSKYDRDSYAYQLYLAYQQYPQTLLNDVLTRMRHDQMISYKKCYNRSLMAQNCLPLSTSPFQLSVTYLHIFNFKYQFGIFSQAWQLLKQLMYKKHEEVNKQKERQKARDPETPEECAEPGEEASDGLPILINQEGGMCAAIVALMATRRLVFYIVIPEQIITMDQKQPLPNDQNHSLLRRFSDHTKVSGRVVKDLKFESITTSPSCLSSFRTTQQQSRARGSGEEKDEENKEESASASSECKANTRKRKESEKDTKQCKKKKHEQELSEQQSITSPQPATIPARRRSLRRASQEEEAERKAQVPAEIQEQQKQESTQAMSTTGKEEEVDEEDEELTEGERGMEDLLDAEDSSNLPGDASSMEDDLDVSSQGRGSQLLSSSSSRLGLYMMRDQLTQASAEKINIQHVQELLVVNACDITCRLRPPPERQEEYEEAVRAGGPEHGDDLLLPLPQANVARALAHRKRLTCNIWGKLEDEVQQWKEEGVEEEVVQVAQALYTYIDSFKELGASITSIKEEFRDCMVNVTYVLYLLEEARVLLRVGVAVVRWITPPHTRPWLIHTNKITRTKRHSVRIQGVYRMNLTQKEKEEAAGASDNTVVVKGEQQDVCELPSDTLDQDGLQPSTAASAQPQDQEPKQEGWHVTDEAINQDVALEQNQEEGATDEVSQDQTTEQDVSEPGDTETAAQLPDPDEKPYDSDGADPEEGARWQEEHSEGQGLDSEVVACAGDSGASTSRRSRRISLRHFRLSDAEAEKEVGETSGQGTREDGQRHIRSSQFMRKRKYKKDEEQTREMENTIKQHQTMSDYEEIQVAVRPWVRLNGTLNRRVIDRMLGAVLCLVMERPGISGRDVVCRFSPALQPAHTHELLDTLVELQCVVRQELVLSHQPALFSPTVSYTLEAADIHDCDDNIMYEPEVDAVLKLGMFIGDKKYCQDFLSGDRR